MTDRDAFLEHSRPRRERLEALLGAMRPSAAEWREIAALYRAIGADLSRARTLHVGDDVQRALDDLAGRAHNRLYGARAPVSGRLRALLGQDFPREVRAAWPAFLLANLLFYGPLLVGLFGAVASPEFATAVLPAEQLDQMEQMYASSDVARGAGEDATMAGFYVANNVGIAFRCFATGALGGLGSMFFLVANGLTIGTVIGYLATVGKAANLAAFIAGHGPWELTAIVIAGAAGLELGWALIETGGLTRAASVRRKGPRLFRLISGAAAMLFVAAAIEGFWSAGPVPIAGKFAFGLLQAALVAGWLFWGGRGGSAR